MPSTSVQKEREIERGDVNKFADALTAGRTKDFSPNFVFNRPKVQLCHHQATWPGH